MALAWTDNDTAGVEWVIDRATDSNFTNPTQFDDTTPSSAGYSDTTVTPGTTYYYQVAELDAQGNQSAWSNTVTVTTPLAALPAPTNVTATAYAPGTAPARVVLTWTQYPPVTRFIVERATNAHFTLGFRRVRARAWTRTVTLGGLLRNHRYYVRIRAVNGYLTSRWTTVKVITPS